VVTSIKKSDGKRDCVGSWVRWLSRISGGDVKKVIIPGRCKAGNKKSPIQVWDFYDFMLQ
jgi:hypothetical protein